MKIVDMKTLNETQLLQAAQMLTHELPLGWPALEDAVTEVKERWADEPGALFLAAVESGDVVGWCGMLPQYDGKVFELHPLVVRHDLQRHGIGTRLVNEIVKAARKQGGRTLYLGADDEKPGGETSFANVDLYDDLPKRMQTFDPGTHQASFYQNLGFKVVGVMPDANGIGKPDIFMAKRL